MIRTCLKVIRQSIASKRVDSTARQLKKDHRIDFYPVVGIRERKLGACVFNQPANQNLLSEEFVDELYRFLLSYQYDNTVENVWIESKDNVFTHGVDFKRLAEDKGYLDKLAKLSILVARFNKPMFGQIAGGAKGAGAYLLSMINMPFGYRSAFLKLDECSRGMVPLFGGSHRLARLPMRLGYYLALTGDELNSEEMAQLGFIKGAIEQGATNSKIREKFHEANLFFRQKFRYMDFDEPEAFLEAEQKVKLEQKKNRYYSELKYFQTELLSESPRNLNVKFAVNQHIAASVDYHNATNPFSSFSQAESGRTINNYFSMRLERPLEYLKEHDLVTSFDIRGVELKRLDLGRIDHIFGKGSVGDIMEALKEEKSQWAQRAYRRMKSADPLAVRLTYELIKKAETQPWISCLELEFSVARKLLEMSKLSLKTFPKSSHYVFTNEHTESDVTKISQAVIDSFFTTPEGDYKLEHEVRPYSLIPVNDYYKDIPDSVRKYLNCEQFVDKHNTEQTPQILRFLNQSKINYKSKVFDVNILRKKVYQKLEMEKDKNRMKERLQYLAAHDQELQRYRKIREEYLNSVDNQKLEQSIDQQVKKVFEDKFQQRFSAFESKTATVVGLERKIQLFKQIKDIILNNLLYNGYEYEKSKFGQSDYTGLIYFDSKGKDVYNSSNPYLQKDEAIKQIGEDLSKGVTISEGFEKYQGETLPTYFGTPDEEMPFEKKNREMWEKIRFRYDEKPELWAEAYIYKELIIQASRTSEELAGFLDWNFQNFYDLLNYTEKMRENYGDLAIDMANEVTKARSEKIQKLTEVQKERNIFLQKGLFSKMYKWKEQRKMREIFPYYFKQSQVPGEFRRSFLSVLDSTLKQFTSMYGAHEKHSLLVKQQLGVLDKWINSDLTNEYTEFLKYDVEYVTSYLQILFVKEMLTEQIKLNMIGRGVEESAEIMLEKFNVDFAYNENEVSMGSMNKSITKYLYFLVDMHTNAKRHIKSPQAKLLDFINRLKVNYQFDADFAMPYSFEGLLLLIGKDRKKIYDRYLGNSYIAEPQFLLEYVSRESKRTVPSIIEKHSALYPEKLDGAFQSHYHMHHASHSKTKHLIQNYFYYMMQFERHIHVICGRENFIPEKFVPKEQKEYVDYCKNVISSDSSEDWYQKEVKAVIEQLLGDREEVEKKLTKGELFLYDQDFAKKLEVGNIRKLISCKLTEQVFMVKNLFVDRREYNFKPTEAEESDFEYTKTKRIIKNPEALKKLNNLSISEQIYLEYMSKKEDEAEDDLLPEQRKFIQSEQQYYKNGFTTRLPFKSYHRMARDVFVYPEQMVSVPSTEREVDLFKKISINFQKSLAGEKIDLSNFSSEYKELNKKLKDSVLEEMADKISRVESL